MTGTAFSFCRAGARVTFGMLALGAFSIAALSPAASQAWKPILLQSLPPPPAGAQTIQPAPAEVILSQVPFRTYRYANCSTVDTAALRPCAIALATVGPKLRIQISDINCTIDAPYPSNLLAQYYLLKGQTTTYLGTLPLSLQYAASGDQVVAANASLSFTINAGENLNFAVTNSAGAVLFCGVSGIEVRLK